MTEVLALYYSSYDRIENMALPALVSFGTGVITNSDLAAPLRLYALLAEPKRTTFYDDDHRGYSDYQSWHRMA